ncbi:MAG: tRNA 2-thiouridine(34) synthase MnmA [Alphaproteobacteria bacterium]|nr:tRNA 2-thiouridine(34) synthase MnmA [Alphaproteobacteria bacterium]
MIIDPAIIEKVHAAMNLPGRPKDHRVVVAMSGGVDSSVVAGLVKLAGYDVVGITLQLYDHGEAIRRKGACCAGQDIHDARRVAAALDIPHYVLDFESRFKEAVIDDFVESYLQGATPIPCVKCNQTVKFADLLARAKDLDASCLVTGHYIESRMRAGGGRDLFTPVDMARDQSYFLFATTQEQIDFLRFPLGQLPKPAVREVAAAMGLMVADKPDSQDICFVPGGKYADVILKIRPDAAEGGEIVHLDGRVLGQHDGIIHYTIGQRKGLGIGGGEPLFVVKLEAEARRVIVGPREALKQSEIRISQLNWLGDVMLGEEPIKVFAKIRSTRPPVEASIRLADSHIVVAITGGEYGVSPGQACVLYDGAGVGAKVLGGGFIALERPRAAFVRSATVQTNLVEARRNG